MKCSHNNCFDRFILFATRWIGTPMSLIVHTIFFIGIFFPEMAAEPIWNYVNTIAGLMAIPFLCLLAIIFLAINIVGKFVEYIIKTLTNKR